MEEQKKEEVLYQKVPSTENVSQGDILFNLPIFLPDQTKIDADGKVPFEAFAADIIILSQSCDLVLDPARNRLPVDPVVCAAIHHIGCFSKTLVTETNSGRKPSYYLLNKDNVYMERSYIIDFGAIYTIPYKILSEFATNQGDRFRPISPILEKISQHFGNYFSRIGTEYERDPKELKEEHSILEKKYKEELEAQKQAQLQQLKQKKKHE